MQYHLYDHPTDRHTTSPSCPSGVCMMTSSFNRKRSPPPERGTRSSCVCIVDEHSTLYLVQYVLYRLDLEVSLLVATVVLQGPTKLSMVLKRKVGTIPHKSQQYFSQNTLTRSRSACRLAHTEAHPLSLVVHADSGRVDSVRWVTRAQYNQMLISSPHLTMLSALTRPADLL